MSGLEVIGAISAIIAIVDASIKVYDHARKNSKLPEAFDCVGRRLPILIDTLETCKNHLEPIQNSLPADACEALEKILEDCDEKARKLREILEKVVPGSKDTWDKRYLKAVKGVWKGNKVEELMKSMTEDIQLVVNHHAVNSASPEQMTKLDEVITEMKSVKSSSPEEDLGMMFNSGGGAQTNNVNVGSGQQINNNAAVGTQNYYSVTSEQVFVVTSSIARETLRLLADDSSRKKNGHTDWDIRLPVNGEQLPHDRTSDSSVTVSVPTDQFSNKQTTNSQLKTAEEVLEDRLCTCRPRNERTVQKITSFIAVVTNSRIHSNTCRVSMLKQNSILRRSIQVALPTWFLNRIVEISYNSTAGFGGYFLSHMTMAVRPNIKWYQLPHFVSIQQFWTRKLCRQWSEAETLQQFERLLQSLDQGFLGRTATALDVDADEGSLLHFAVIGFLQAGNRDQLALDLCRRLILFLDGWGVPRDYIPSSNAFVFHSREIWDMIILNFSSTAINESLGHGHFGDPRFLSPIRRLLFDIGVPLASITPSQNTIYGKEMAALLSDFPEMLEEWECSSVAAAVINRSEEKLHRLLKAGHDPNQANCKGQTPLHLSAKWPRGVELLLEFGADTNRVDDYGDLPIFYAITCNNLETTKLLLEQDCDFCNRDDIYDTYSIYEQVLYASPELRREFFSVLAARRDLMQRILRNANEEDAKEVDDSIPSDVMALLSIRLHSGTMTMVIPSDVENGLTTVFHRRFNSHSVRMVNVLPDAVTIANELYDLRFNHIDICDRFGFTPLLECCSRGEYDMISWLLDKGAVPRKVKHYENTPLQLLLNWASRYNESIRGKLLETVKCLINAGETFQSHDSCDCGCAPNGCSPVTTYLRMGDAGKSINISEATRWRKFQQLLRIINEIYDEGDIRSQIITECWHDFARLEFFERHSRAHTCCHIDKDGIGRTPEEYHPYSTEELDEYRDHADHYIEIFITELQKRPGNEIEVFKEWVELDRVTTEEDYQKVLDRTKYVQFQQSVWQYGPTRITGNPGRNLAHFTIEIPDPPSTGRSDLQPPKMVLMGRSMIYPVSPDGQTSVELISTHGPALC